MSTEWVDAIRVASHVNLTYDVDVLVDTIEAGLRPFTEFRENFTDSAGPSNVQINLSPSDSSVKSANLSPSNNALQQLPTLLGQLFLPTTLLDPAAANKKLQDIIPSLDISEKQRSRLLSILAAKNSTSQEHDYVAQNPGIQKFQKLSQSLRSDIDQNKTLIADLGEWATGKNPRDILMIAQLISGSVHLAREHTVLPPSPLLSTLVSLDSPLPIATLVTQAITLPAPTINPPQISNIRSLDTSTLKKTK